MACGKCWELAIRDDERAVVVFGLPRELVPDPAYVDEIAVERVLSGERITLTAAERRAAAAELARRRATVSEIAERLEMKNSTVRGLLDAIDAAVDLDGDKPKRRLRADPTTFAPRATTATADTDPTGEAA